MRLLRETDRAIAEFAATGDAEALHAVRVSLRHLRGWLQGFAALLPVKHRQRRRLRRLAHSTNIARDAEISLQRLLELQAYLGARARPGVAAVARSLTALREEEHRRLRRKLPVSWRRLSAKLRKALQGSHGHHAASPRFIEAFARSLQSYAESFETALAEARRAPDAQHIHRLRIAGKKLRYLVETIIPWYPAARPMVRELASLHAVAGSIQDLQRFTELSEQVFLRQAGANYRRLLLRYVDTGLDERRLPQPSTSRAMLPLLLICRTAALRKAAFIAAVRKAYLGRRLPACVRHMRALATRLQGAL